VDPMAVQRFFGQPFRDRWVPELAWQRLGLKPVVKWRVPGVDTAERVRRELAELGHPAGPVRALRDEAGAIGSSGAAEVELFLGAKEEDLRQAVTLRDEQDTVEPGTPRFAELDRQLGALLGYPACCTEAYTGRAVSDPRADDLHLLGARLASPEQIAWELNPFGYPGLLPPYFPCSFVCGESLTRARAALALAREVHGERFARELTERLQRPWLFGLRSPFRVELLPDSLDLERFRGRVGTPFNPASPRYQAIREADEILFDGPTMIFQREGRHLAAWPLMAALFWTGGLPGRDWLERYYRQALRNLREDVSARHDDSPARTTGAAVPPPEEDETGARFTARLTPWLRPLIAKGVRLGGWRATRFVAGRGCGRLFLTHGESREAVLMIAEDTEQAFARTSHWVIRYSSNVPLADELKQGLQGWVAALAKVDDKLHDRSSGRRG